MERARHDKDGLLEPPVVAQQKDLISQLQADKSSGCFGFRVQGLGFRV